MEMKPDPAQYFIFHHLFPWQTLHPSLTTQVFEEMAKEYPQIQTDHQIVDIATARIAAKPQKYDVVVTSNLYGDIISVSFSSLARSLLSV